MSEPTGKPVLGTIDRVLAFMDKPWKAMVVLIFAVVGGVGWFLYQERVRIADAILHKPIVDPKLDVKLFERDVAKLLSNTTADIAILIELDLDDNVSINRVGIDREGNHWVPVEGPQPAFYPETRMSYVIKFLRNEVLCDDTEHRPAPDFQVLFAAGYKRACLVSVPPIMNVTLGGLMIAWRIPPTENVEARAGTAITLAAMKFATW